MSDQVYTASEIIKADPGEVFTFLRVPENQPRWAVNFVRSTRPLGDGRYVMQTPFGEMTYRVDADERRRTVDFVFETPYGTSVLPARVVPHSRGAIVTFTIDRQPGTPDDAWAAGVRGLDDELSRLRRILESPETRSATP
jgi:uncharacterized protein YndB with AHSA1/START domain